MNLGSQWLSSGQAKQYEQEGLNAPVPFAGLGGAVETGMVRFRFAFTHHGHSLSHYGSLMFTFPRMLSSTRDAAQSMDRHIHTYLFFDFFAMGQEPAVLSSLWFKLCSTWLPLWYCLWFLQCPCRCRWIRQP